MFNQNSFAAIKEKHEATFKYLQDIGSDLLKSNGAVR